MGVILRQTAGSYFPKCAGSYFPFTADRIVILLPLPDDLSGMFKAQKPVYVQVFIPEPAVKAFDVSVVDRVCPDD